MATAASPQTSALRIEGPKRTFSQDVPVFAAVLLGYMLLLPPQVNVSLAGSVLPPYRLFLIASVLYIIPATTAGRIRFAWPDVLVLAATFWIAVSLFVTTGGTDAIVSAIAQITDIALVYFFARAAFSDLRAVRLFLLLLAPGLFLVSVITIVESITHRHILQPLLSSLLGVGYNTEYLTRLGLMRAKGPFPHPILAGIFMASFLPLYFMSGLRRWPWLLGVVASAASIFTMSSAALLALVAGGALIAYNWITERIANLTWRMFFFGTGMVVLIIELASNSGAYSVLLRYAALNSASAFNRRLIWRIGSNNVEKNPWFGIGFNDWDRPVWMSASIDHYWLLLAMQFGVLPPVLILMAVFLAVWSVMRRSTISSPVDRRMLRGLAISMGVFALGALSVSLWLGIQTWFYMLLAITVSIGYAQDRSSVRRPRAGFYGQRRQMRLSAPKGRPINASTKAKPR